MRGGAAVHRSARQDVHRDGRNQLEAIAARPGPQRAALAPPAHEARVALRDLAVPHVLVVAHQERAEAQGQIRSAGRC
jgi:hypothetical protein